MKRIARITYHNEYMPFGEGYSIEILTEKGFELESFFTLQHCIVDSSEDERNFIHFSFIKKIRNLVEMGYSLQFNV